MKTVFAFTKTLRKACAAAPGVTLAALLSLGPVSARAGQILGAGVLGNSGEQGKSLVRFNQLQSARGMGVVADETGSLWDRAGSGTLNRYARDGRLLATYRLPEPQVPGNDDRMVRVGKRIVCLIRDKIYTLAVDAPSGSELEDANIPATLMSLNAVDGYVLLGASEDRINYSISRYNPETGDHSPYMEKEVPKVREIAYGSDKSMLIRNIEGKLELYRDGRKVEEGWPKAGPGDRLTQVGPFWYGSSYHGTLRRFTLEMVPDPGVVLGGGSGSFIGHVDANTELEYPEGLVYLGRDLWAASGMFGIMHLMHWDQKHRQFTLIRRIGAVPVCESLGINRKGQVWFYTGFWNWADDPSSILRECSGGAQWVAGRMGQVAMLPNDLFVAPIFRGHGTSPFIMGGPFSWRLSLTELFETFETPKKAPTSRVAGTAVYLDEERRMVMLGINKEGKGETIRINMNGQAFNPDGRVDDPRNPVVKRAVAQVELKTKTPVKAWTSLGMKSPDVLIGAADGYIIELDRYGADWQETRRWNTWKLNGAPVAPAPASGLSGAPAAPATFGNSIHLSVDAGRVWVADTENHRVLCIDLATENLLGAFGTPGKPGDTLATLNAPRVIAAREKRAVVFDSGNQRLVKLQLVE